MSREIWSEYRQVLLGIAIWIYNDVIKLMKGKVQPLNMIQLLVSSAASQEAWEVKLIALLMNLSHHWSPSSAADGNYSAYYTLAMFGTDPKLITQVFRQMLTFIIAGSLNTLLVRKDMCHWSKGMEIHYNLIHLEQWTGNMQVHESGMADTLTPIIQATLLLQACKTDDDAQFPPLPCSLFSDANEWIACCEPPHLIQLVSNTHPRQYE